jgi:EAL domain-containing protein (putative c-di-GMP-specific phosphodiesterase class I)
MTAAHPATSNRILLVDDDPLVRRAYARAFRADGHVVEVASDAREAMEALGRGPYNAIFSDISLPGQNGLELLRSVRERDQDVPVVLITGDPHLDTAIRAVEYGAARYLVKPVDADTLSSTARWATDAGAAARSRRATLAAASPEARVSERDDLEARFDRALAALWVAWQPIVSGREGRVFGYEALLRSREPSLPNPPAVLEAAERLGRTRELGARMRSLAAASAADAPPDALLFLNLHPYDLLDDDLYRPHAPLAAIAHRVVLELTERAALDEVPDLAERRERLRMLGFRLAIDDLGAGYAGLTSLVALRPDIVKMDMTLSRGIQSDPARQKVVASIVVLARQLGMEIVAEGIETAAERDEISRLGCDLFQGYLFARPGPGFVSLDLARAA